MTTDEKRMHTHTFRRLHFLDRLDTDILSQRYINLQSLVKCLDHRGIASDTYAVKQGCVRLRNALTRI